MGMFDWYEPDPPLSCPTCAVPLTEWQGKDADCCLFVWHQGVPHPAWQSVEREFRFDDENLADCRLPDSFRIYSYDCDAHCVTASCHTEDGVWTTTRITDVSNLKTGKNV